MRITELCLRDGEQLEREVKMPRKIVQSFQNLSFIILWNLCNFKILRRKESIKIKKPT